MGFFDKLADIANNRTSDFNRRVRNECDKLDRKIDTYERTHPNESEKINDYRNRVNNTRNNHK